MNDQEYISVKEAAQLLGVTPRTVHNYRERGLILARRLPPTPTAVRRFRIFRNSVQTLIKSLR